MEDEAVDKNAEDATNPTTEADDPRFWELYDAYVQQHVQQMVPWSPNFIAWPCIIYPPLRSLPLARHSLPFALYSSQWAS